MPPIYNCCSISHPIGGPISLEKLNSSFDHRRGGVVLGLEVAALRPVKEKDAQN